MEQKRKRRFGDRKEGRYLRNLDAYYKFAPFIMKTRGDSSIYFRDSVEITEVDRFLRKKREEDMPGLGMLHLLAAAYVRVTSQRPPSTGLLPGSGSMPETTSRWS
jgi:hypothetical protein